MSAEPSTVVTTRPTRSEPYSRGGGKLTDIAFMAGTLAVGAVAGYFALDYTVKNHLLDKLLAKVGLSTGNGASTNPEGGGDVNTGDDETEANVAYISPLWPQREGVMYDRDTRQTTSNAINAYVARKQFGPRMYLNYDEDETTHEGTFNQVVTESDVFDNI